MSRLEQEIRKYLEGGSYPFHMPGHKRKNLTGAALPYELDMTEIPATDDLHEAEGILRSAMERTAELFHARRSWYLVNGSTCGNLAGIFAITRQGGEIIAARNCHRSVFHAIELRNLRVHWVLPEYDEELGIYGSVLPERIEKLISEHPGVEAVVLTSPSYEGVLSDIERIAELCHRGGALLLVDEAHGAHFSLEDYLDGSVCSGCKRDGEYAGLYKERRSENVGDISPKHIRFPMSALHYGADIVVQSPHKTLPSLTQTALLHLGSKRVSERRIERMLGIFESSSPSYPLMLSLDSCTELLLKHGCELFGEWRARLSEFYKDIAGLKQLRLIYPYFLEVSGGNTEKGLFFDCDPSKLLINTGKSGMSGEELIRLLRERFGLELEMSSGNNVLAMTAVADSSDAYRRLSAALLCIDREIAAGKDSEIDKSRDTAGGLGYTGLPERMLPEARLSIGEAVERRMKTALLNNAVGELAGEYIYLYPPGIPLIAPGELISSVLLRHIEALRVQGISLHFTESGKNSESIFIVD